MKQILVAVMAALLLVGCQQSDTGTGTDTGGTTTTNAPAVGDTNAPVGGTE